MSAKERKREKCDRLEEGACSQNECACDCPQETKAARWQWKRVSELKSESKRVCVCV